MPHLLEWYIPAPQVDRLTSVRRELDQPPAALRAEAGADPDDPRLGALVGELSVTSERFRKLWARHDVRRGESAGSIIHHPQVGDLQLWREKFSIAGTDGLTLAVYHAAPGSRSADALSLLSSLAADHQAAVGQPSPAEHDPSQS